MFREKRRRYDKQLVARRQARREETQRAEQRLRADTAKDADAQFWQALTELPALFEEDSK